MGNGGQGIKPGEGKGKISHRPSEEVAQIHLKKLTVANTILEDALQQKPNSNGERVVLELDGLRLLDSLDLGIVTPSGF